MDKTGASGASIASSTLAEGATKEILLHKISTLLRRLNLQSKFITFRKYMKSKTHADFLFEAATLKRLKRTGWQILGENEESIAEHSYMVAVISYLLAKELHADVGRVLSLSLFHDFSEVRVGDVYKLADCYVRVDELAAAKDAFAGSADPEELTGFFLEYEKEMTKESKIVHDADTLALCIELKQLVEKGNKHAK